MDRTSAEVELIVSAVPVPVLVVDYTPIMTRYDGMSAHAVETVLSEDDRALLECLRLPVPLATSPEWVRLYGSPLSASAPDLADRHFTTEDYPDPRASLVAQFTAPFSGRTSIVREHVAPTLFGDVIVRSHWQASTAGGRARYDRVVIVDLDVTGLRSAQRGLEDTLNARDRLVATVSHELRNPMTSIMGLGSLLRSDWDALQEDDRREMAAMLAGEAEDAVGILDDLLTNAAGDSLQVSQQVVPVTTVVEAFDLGGVDCSVDPSLQVVGDPMRIRQVIRNLLQNATRHGGPTHRLVTDSRDGMVRISVLDNGAGVAPELIDTLFQPFAHGGGSGSVGLGLAVCHDLAQAMGGSLEHNRRDEWTEFSLVLHSADELTPSGTT